MAVYWVDPCLGVGFTGITEACHGTTGTAKTGTYSNPWGLDEIFNTTYTNPLGLVDGDEVRIKGEQDSFWWSSDTWDVRGQDTSLNTGGTTSLSSYFYLYNGANTASRPTGPFLTTTNAAMNGGLFMVHNTSDFNCGWDDRFMFIGHKYGSDAIAETTTGPMGAAMSYIAPASNRYQRVGTNTSSTTPSTNPEVQLKWCVKVPPHSTQSNTRYWLGLHSQTVTSGGTSVSGRRLIGGVTVTDGWSSETAQTSGYYSIMFAPFAHNSSSAGRQIYWYVGPISMRNCYIVGWRTSNQYYSASGGGYIYFQQCTKPTQSSSTAGSNVFTQTIYLPSAFGYRIWDDTSYYDSDTYARYEDIRYGTIGARDFRIRARQLGRSLTTSTQTNNYQIHFERIFLSRSHTQNIYFENIYQPSNSNYISDAASSTGTSGIHFGDIIALPSNSSNGSSFSIFKTNSQYVTVRLKDNSIYHSNMAPFFTTVASNTYLPLNFHAGSNLKNSVDNPDFSQWPFASDITVEGPTCVQQGEATKTCPREVIDASQTAFYSLKQITIPLADSGAQTFTAGRINFVNNDAGLFDQNLFDNLANPQYNNLTQLIFKECNLTENSGGPVIYGTGYDVVVAGTARGCFAYTNSDNELVIIPNRDSSKTNNRAIFFLPTTIPDISSATSMTTTVTFYVSNWPALSGNNEILVEYKPISTMTADGTISVASAYGYRTSSNSSPTQSNPATATYTRTIGSSGNIQPVTSSSINPAVAYIGVGAYFSNTGLSANSRLIIKSLAITVS